jgi:hypothetical protein
LIVVLPQKVPPPVTDTASGSGLTVTDVVYTVDGVQPDAVVPFVTINEYVLVTVGVAVGFSAVVEESPGPLHT